MELILKTIYAIAITQMWIGSTPLIIFKEWIGFVKDEVYNSKFKNFLNELIYCSVCSGFWITMTLLLIPMNDFIHVVGIASIAAILSELLTRYLNK